MRIDPDVVMSVWTQTLAREGQGISSKVGNPHLARRGKAKQDVACTELRNVVDCYMPQRDRRGA
jgi:hypothetical protein